ncbi:connector enhancer of kinase suppressor of ras 1 isoform X2 [Pseudophryne corroboree]|uniref:connector enhancer of kinase suppressor of ras 1 isoform X2 n=1 Tax=Pseudophryne corroboree TaxID=495146 RepID=UPI003081D9F5
MEPISSWSSDTVRAYLEGLDPSVQHYPFQEWNITGQDLLDLSPQHLDGLGVRSIGHQEIILEAVEQLCALHYDLQSESLCTLTDKLYGVAQMLSSHILALKRVSSVSQTSAQSPTRKQLACIIDIVSAARGLFSWLNRYLFTRLNDYSACRDVIAFCIELADTLHKDWADPQVENRILTICENICEICRSILNCSPESLLAQTATLEPVQICSELSQSLGIEIKSTSSGQHFVCLTTAESPARLCGQILPGDEIIKVNDQVVVGWPQKNLVLKLQERSNFVTLVLKKVSIFPSKTPVSPNKKTVHGIFSSVSAHSAPVSPTYSVLSSSSEHKTVSILKANSVPNLLIKHEKLLPTQSAPTILTDNYSLVLKSESGVYASLEHSGTVSSSGKNLAEEKHNQPSESSSPMHNTWPFPGAPSHCKPHASSVFSSLSISPCSSDPTSLQNMSSTIYAKTLTPVAQLSPVVDPQDLKYTIRPRSDSDSSSAPTISLLSVPLSPGVLRPSISDSNLVTPTNLKAIPKFQLEERKEDVYKSLEEGIVSSKDQHSDKRQDSQSNSRPKTDKETTSGSRQHQKRVNKLSRRRVSCRDLASPDCDGWLWKKKENVGFMSQKWKRCWCVLKKDRFFWYNAPQDEKALGLLNMSLYKLESPLEAKPKKKYEFQLTHPTYKPFVFAADNLTDMKKWVTCLIKALQKFKAPPNSNHSKEEDCYSETEAEDDDHMKAQDVIKKQLVQSPNKNIPGAWSPSASEEGAEGGQLPKSSNAQSQVDDLHIMMSCLKQGGVSLIGKKTAMTQDEYRKSFIRRNKNPEINQKAHTLRVMHSTLKAKLIELQALNQILESPNLNSATFQKWKSEHEQLYGTIGSSPQAPRKSGGDMHQEGATDNLKSKQDSEESEASD